MGFDSYKAMRLTPAFAASAQWVPLFRPLCGVLGFLKQYPSVREFVRAVAHWQRLHPHLKADGILGAKTWKEMQPIVQDYNGDMPGGPYPEWVLRASMELLHKGLTDAARVMRQVMVAHAQRGRAHATARHSTKTADELFVDELMAVSRAQKKEPHLPHEVSAAYAATSIKGGVPSVKAASLPGFSLVGELTIRVGQVWPGVRGGARIVVALTPGFDSVAQRFTCTVVFVSGSGRIYVQSGIGWAHDYETVVIHDINRKLAPLKTLLDAQAAFLLGAISATSLLAGAAVLTMSVLAWCGNPKNQQTILLLSAGYAALMKAREVLKVKAPALYDKIFWASLKSVLSEIPAATLKDEKISAMMIGEIICTVGRALLSRRFDMVCEVLQVVAKLTAETLKMTTAKIAWSVTKAAGKSVPGAAERAARSAPVQVADAAALAMAKELAALGITLSDRDAAAVHGEIKRSAQVIRDAIDAAAAALTQLINGLAAVEV